MTNKTKSALEKLQSLEQQKQQLIKKRYQELLNIIIKQNALTVDDQLLAGFLLFISNPANQKHPILTEFKELVKSTKSPSKVKSPNEKSA